MQIAARFRLRPHGQEKLRLRADISRLEKEVKRFRKDRGLTPMTAGRAGRAYWHLELEAEGRLSVLKAENEMWRRRAELAEDAAGLGEEDVSSQHATSRGSEAFSLTPRT